MTELRQPITLGPGEADTIAFMFTPTEAGIYTVTGNGITIDFEVAQLQPNIEVSNLAVTPEVCELGEEAQIAVTATNSGEAVGIKMITVVVSGPATMTFQDEVELAPGASETLIFSYYPLAEGDYLVSIDDFEVGFEAVMGEFAPWDVNMDGCVNVLDTIMVGQHWGETGPPGWIREDVNRDGVISVLDTILVGQHWGEGCIEDIRVTDIVVDTPEPAVGKPVTILMTCENFGNTEGTEEQSLIIE